MLSLGTILFSQTTLIVNVMCVEFVAGNREDAMLDALESISRVLGKQAEYREFVKYVNWAGQDDMPSPTNIASHTPTWVQLLMPLLGKLYDAGCSKGQLDAGFGFMITKKPGKEGTSRAKRKHNSTRLIQQVFRRYRIRRDL
jgi:hypothetical protein